MTGRFYGSGGDGSESQLFCNLFGDGVLIDEDVEGFVGDVGFGDVGLALVFVVVAP